MTADQLQQFLDQLGQKLTPVASHVWSIFVTQAVIVGIASWVGIVIAIIVLAIVILWALNANYDGPDNGFQWFIVPRAGARPDVRERGRGGPAMTYIPHPNRREHPAHHPSIVICCCGARVAWGQFDKHVRQAQFAEAHKTSSARSSRSRDVVR